MNTHAHSSSSAVARTARLAQEMTRLDLLADINATVDGLMLRAREFQAMATSFAEFETTVPAFGTEPGVYIDPDFQWTGALEKAESELEAYFPRMTVNRASIDEDLRLSADHRESLHDAYEEVMKEAAFLHKAIQSARAAIIAHDLAVEPKERLPVFDTVASLVADLRSH
jgi:hypothetical protein